jgi:ferredoxin-type protein NapG
MFVPVVHSEHCTGCGICEKACPTDEAAIRVLPPELVQGRIGEHYRLGWTLDTPVTQEFKPHARDDEVGQGRAPGGLDYLNEGSL